MGSNGYEIRLTLLQMAKDMAYEKWHAEQNAAFHNANAEKVAVAAIAPPSFAEIEDLAVKLYGFVQNTAPVRQPRHPLYEVPEVD